MDIHAFPPDKELPRNVSALLERSVSMHVFNFIHWNHIFIYLDRWRQSDGVLRTLDLEVRLHSCTCRIEG